MIKNINITWVRWIEINCSIKKNIIIEWDNWTWKSSVINLIKEAFKWKTSIKEWDVTITTEETTIGIKNWKLFSSPWLGVKMDLMTPWFLMNWTWVTWVNKTTEDRRKTISDLLWIDRDWFFKDAWIDYDIKWLTGELKDLRSKEQAYSLELIETENKIKDLKTIKKPKEVILTQWNENEYKAIQERIKVKGNSIVWLDFDWIKPEEIILEMWNEKEFEQLNKELQQIKNEWTSIKESCSTCGQKILDADLVKESLRKKYADKVKEITDFNIVKNNVSEYNLYRDKLSKYENWLKKLEETKENNLRFQEEIIELEKDLSEFKLVTWNKEEYLKYQESLNEYNKFMNTKKILWDRVKDLESKIKWLDSLSIETKVRKYKDTEKEFVKWVENKLVVGDLKIIFFEELKTANQEWELYKPTFNLEYKWVTYDECSSGQRYTIDCILAYLFIKVYWILDFILIDSAEIWDTNLKSLINNELKDLQVIATRIKNSKLIIK